MLLSIFQTVGAGLGFILAGITLYSHLTKGHPIASIVAGANPNFPKNRRTVVAIRNPSDWPILVILPNKAPAGHFTIWPDNETLSAVYSQTEGETVVAVDAGHSYSFPIFGPKGFEDDDDFILRCNLRWRYAQETFVNLSFPIRMAITVGRYKQLQAAVTRKGEFTADLS